ncbi:hypothetical protein MRX96_037399 [Rhipicephalus microplus]
MSLNLPIHSEPIIRIQQEKEAEPWCKCSDVQQSQTAQPTGPQQMIALQTPAQKMRPMQTFYNICEVFEKERRHPYSEKEKSQRDLLTWGEPAGHGDAETGFDEPPMRLKSRIHGASAHGEGGRDIDAMTGPDKPRGSLESADGEPSAGEEPAADINTVTHS